MLIVTISRRRWDPVMSEVNMACYLLFDIMEQCTYGEHKSQSESKTFIHIFHEAVSSKTVLQTDTPTLAHTKSSHIQNVLAHTHTALLALHDSFLNFCPLSTSCSAILWPVSRCMFMCEALEYSSLRALFTQPQG